MIEHDLVKQSVEEAPCEREGCDQPGFACYLPDASNTDPPFAYLCSEHAFEAGFCKMCGLFEGGVESFEFGPLAGYCDNCKIEVEHMDSEDDDGFYGYDPEDDF